jgi:hypothetical protein
MAGQVMQGWKRDVNYFIPIPEIAVRDAGLNGEHDPLAAAPRGWVRAPGRRGEQARHGDVKDQPSHSASRQ